MSTPATSDPPSENPHPVERIKLEGHLTVAQITEALSPVTERSAQQVALYLLFDCRTMTSYDRAARDYFVLWHKQLGSRVKRVAIVTTNPLWSVVIAGMSLASGHPMKSFPHPIPAEQWLASLTAHK